LVVVLAIVLLAVGGVAFFIFQAGGAIGTFERFGWDDIGGAPVVVNIDGSEAFIGRIRSYSKNHQLSVVAVDSATCDVLWRTKDMGTYNQAYQNVRFAAVGDRVVVSDYKATVHTHELRTGKLLNSLQMTDKVTQICPVTGTTSVWVGVADQHNIVLDLASGVAQPWGQSAGCSSHPQLGRSRHRGGELPGAPQVQGFQAEQIHTEGTLAVASGVRTPGTALPMAVGFNPQTGAVLWQRQIATVDITSVREGTNEYSGLANERFVSVYGVGQDNWRVAALDANTGTALWDVELRDIFAVDSIDNLIVSPGFVYIVRTSSLEVLNVQTGILIGTIGDETYE
jgi:outer membrane protein assembly factor BamB